MRKKKIADGFHSKKTKNKNKKQLYIFLFKTGKKQSFKNFTLQLRKIQKQKKSFYVLFN